MIYDPLSAIVEEPITIDASVMESLHRFRASEKLVDLPGVAPELERERLARALDDLVDTVINGIELHPSKRWVFRQFQRFLVDVSEEDTEARECVGTELEQLMEVLSIESSDGLLSYYLGGI